MAYIIAAAQCLSRRVALAVIFALPALGLAGCGTANNILGSNSGAPAVAAAPAAQPAAARPAVPTRATVAIAPIIGAPDQVADQLAAQLGQSVQQQQVGVSRKRTDKVDYTLRGYVVAANDRAGTKVSYIWDVTNQAGKRVKRITGEEVIRGGKRRDPWSAMTPNVMKKIADRTATIFGRWLPAPAAVAGNAQPPARSGVGAQASSQRSHPSAVARPQEASARRTLGCRDHFGGCDGRPGCTG